MISNPLRQCERAFDMRRPTRVYKQHCQLHRIAALSILDYGGIDNSHTYRWAFKGPGTTSEWLLVSPIINTSTTFLSKQTSYKAPHNSIQD